jgi:hypothetical protein
VLSQGHVVGSVAGGAGDDADIGRHAGTFPAAAGFGVDRCGDGDGRLQVRLNDESLAGVSAPSGRSYPAGLEPRRIPTEAMMTLRPSAPAGARVTRAAS